MWGRVGFSFKVADTTAYKHTQKEKTNTPEGLIAAAGICSQPQHSVHNLHVTRQSTADRAGVGSTGCGIACVGGVAGAAAAAVSTEDGLQASDVVALGGMTLHRLYEWKKQGGLLKVRLHTE